MAWIFLVAAILCNTFANVFIKHASRSEAENPLEVYLSLPFIAGIGLFSLNLLAYTQALKAIPLAIAYPVLVGVSVAGTTFFAIWLFDEPLVWPHYVGIALITAGVGLLAGHGGG